MDADEIGDSVAVRRVGARAQRVLYSRAPSAGHQPAAVHTAAAMLADDLQSVVKDYKQLMTGL